MTDTGRMPSLQITDQLNMSGKTDFHLLAAFARSRDERAFEALVQRHAGWVQAVAQRSLGDRELGQEVTQNVFIHLARKAAGLQAESLGAWLHRVTVLECRNASRREHSRYRTLAAATLEQDHMQPDNSPPDERWRAALPILDEAVDALPETARAVVVQRFLQQRSWREIGESIGRSEDSARMALGPALNRLARVLRKRGVAVPVPALAAVLSVSPNTAGNLSAASLTKIALAGSSVRTLPAWWKSAAAAWLSSAVCLVAGSVAGYRLSGPGNAAPAGVFSVPSGAAKIAGSSTRPGAAENGFDLSEVLSGLRALKPSGNNLESIVHLRAMLLKMPPAALPQVLAAMRKRTWGEDSRNVAAAFFCRWAVLDVESAWAESRDPDFLGAASKTTRALLKGTTTDDPAMFVRLINTLPDTEVYPDAAVTVAAKARLGDLPVESVMPHLSAIKPTSLRRSLILALLERPLTSVEFAMIAPVTVKLHPVEAGLTVPALSERWYQTAPESFLRWKETLPPGSSWRWTAVLGEASAVSATDPAEAGKLLAGIPWTELSRIKMEKILDRWIETDPASAGEWLSSATTIPAPDRERFIARVNDRKHKP